MRFFCRIPRKKSSLLAAGLGLACAATGMFHASAGPLSTSGPSAPGPDADLAAHFRTAYNIFMKAEECRDSGRWSEAAHYYNEAGQAYTRLVERFPAWEPAVFRFRIAYCEGQAKAMRKKAERASSDKVAGDQGRPAVTAAAPPSVGTSGRTTPAEAIRTARPLLLAERGAEARAILLDALRQDPDSRSIRFFLATAQCQAGNLSDAQHILEGLLEENPLDAHARVLLGISHFGLGQVEKAKQEMERALDTAPGMPEAYYNLAEILLFFEPPATAVASNYYWKSVQGGGARDPDLEKRLSAPAESGPSPSPARSGSSE